MDRCPTVRCRRFRNGWMFGPIHPRTAPSSPPAGTRGKVAGRCRWWGSGPIRRSSLAINPDGFQSNQGPAFPGHGVSCVSFPGYSSQELQLLTLPGNKLVVSTRDLTVLPGVAFTKPRPPCPKWPPTHTLTAHPRCRKQASRHSVSSLPSVTADQHSPVDPL